MRPRLISTAFAALLLFASIAAPACGQDSATSSDDDEYADEEKAFLIVRKAPLEEDVVVGSNLTVVIDIHNAGSRCAALCGLHAAICTRRTLGNVHSSHMHMRLPRTNKALCGVLPYARTCLALAHTHISALWVDHACMSQGPAPRMHQSDDFDVHVPPPAFHAFGSGLLIYVSTRVPAARRTA